MEEVGIIGLALAKNVFQAHGAATDGQWYRAASCRGSNCCDLLRCSGR